MKKRTPSYKRVQCSTSCYVTSSPAFLYNEPDPQEKFDVYFLCYEKWIRFSIDISSFFSLYDREQLVLLRY
jgi:hypothetical protein